MRLIFKASTLATIKYYPSKRMLTSQTSRNYSTEYNLGAKAHGKINMPLYFSVVNCRYPSRSDREKE